MKCYLREYGRLKTFPVTYADGKRGSFVGSTFGEDDWRIHALLVDTGHRRLVQASEIECVADEPPELRLRCSAGALPATARLPGKRLDTERLLGCALLSPDGFAGKVADLLVNIGNWKIKFFVVDCDERSVLLHVAWTTRLDLVSRRITVDVPAGALHSAPWYGGVEVLTPGYEDIVSRHYTQRDFHS